MSLKVKWGYISARSSKVSVKNVLLCPFHYKPRKSGVSLESPGLENIPQVPGNRAEVGQNHDARKALSPTLSVLKWSGAIFAQTLESERSKSFALFISLLELENFLQGLKNRAVVGENH